jgi:predicted transposase/invertase (TIGR01784 family)
VGKYINPFTDWGFKWIFGQELSKDLLISFLNELLEGERVIEDITFLNNEQQPASKEEKTIIYDVYCRTNTGEEIIVEMQNRAQAHFKERALYYLSNAIVRQGEAGSKWQYEVKAVYGVFFMNFSLPDCKKLRTNVILADMDTGKLFSDKLRQIFISLPEFDKTEEECETNFERWIYVLKNMETLERMPFKASLAVLNKLEEIAKVRALSKEEKRQYDYALNTYRTNRSAWDYAMETSEAKGRKEGEASVQKKTISNLKNMDFPMEVIMKVTGLSAEEIQNL